MEGKFIAIVDSLWHPKRAVREVLAQNGLYVLDMRSWDTGIGNSLENFVVVNYEGSVVVNFEITDWDENENGRQAIFDMAKWLKKHPEVENRDFDNEIEKMVNTILTEAGLEN